MRTLVLCETCGHHRNDHVNGRCQGPVHFTSNCRCKNPVPVEIKTKRDLSRLYKDARAEKHRLTESIKDKEGVCTFTSDNSAAVIQAGEKESYIWSIVIETMSEPPD